MNNYSHTFNSLQELNAFLLKVDREKPRLTKSVLSLAKGDWSNYYETVEDGCTLLINGQKELIEQYMQYVSTVKPEPLPQMQGFDFFDEPITGLFDVPSFCSNERNYWMNEVEQFKTINYATVKINFGADATITAKQFFERFMAICREIDFLEQTGTRCEIIAECKDNFSFTTGFLSVKIKDHSEPINISQIVYLFCTPAMQRFVSFIIDAYYNDYNYGESANCRKYEESEAKKAMETEGYIYCPSFYSAGLGTIVKKSN
jgi:hypothetical protein